MAIRIRCPECSGGVEWLNRFRFGEEIQITCQKCEHRIHCMKCPDDGKWYLMHRGEMTDQEVDVDEFETEKDKVATKATKTKKKRAPKKRVKS